MADKKEYWKSKDWYVGPWNYYDEVRKDFHPPKTVKIHDVTLRDGEQQAGIVFTKDDKIRIADALAEIGVHRIEAGMPAVSPEDAAAVEDIVKRNLGPEIFGFCRAMPEDIKRAADCGVSGVVVEVPANQPFLELGYGWPLEKLIERSIEATQFAKEQGLYTVFFTIDGSRADMDYYFNIVENVANAGYIDALTVVDTFGGLGPHGTGYFVKKVKERIKQPLEMHVHNYFGMATANTVEGILSGAEVFHCTVSGIGEGAGNCPLEETAVALLILYEIDTHIKYNLLRKLHKLVTGIAGTQANRPLVGDMTYKTEIGVGAYSYRKFWKNGRPALPMQYPVAPEFVGNDPQQIMMGKKSGVDNVEMWAERLGIELTREEAKEIVSHVKDKGIELKRLLTEDEFKDVVQVVKNKK